MADGVALESKTVQAQLDGPQPSKSPWRFLRGLSGKFNSPKTEGKVEYQGAAQPKDASSEQPDPQRLYLDHSIMETANKPNLAYWEACKFLDAGAMSMFPPTRTDTAFKEACHKLEAAAYLHRVLVDFSRFAKDQPDITRKDWTGSTPLYRFLIGDNNGSEDSYDSKLLELCWVNSTGLWHRVQRDIEEAKAKGVSHPWSEKSMRSGWLESGAGAVKVEDGKNAIGRIYINPKPQHAFTVAFDIERALLQKPSVIFHRIKVTDPACGLRTLHLTRRDKIVIYFDAKDEEAMLGTLQDLYEGWSGAYVSMFNEEIPLFAAGLLDKQGRKMSGFSFGQEPTVQAKTSGQGSFNEVRAKILQEVKSYVNIGNDGLENQDSLERKFIELATESGIDPYNPAFNLDGQKFFPTIAANSSYI